ncbi:MAG: hypothetical protein ABIO44_07815, partial [Saprospiraceae bacterium]
MKTITSLSKLFVLLFFITFFQITGFSQPLPLSCNPDLDQPILMGCPVDTVLNIVDPTACGIVYSWNTPTSNDLCVATNMLATPGASFFSYYDEFIFGLNGQFIRYGSDSILIVGTTNGLGLRVFQVCFYATCTGTLSFDFRARMNNRDGFNGDRARFMVEDALIPTSTTDILTTGNGNYAFGSRSIPVNYGDRLCFEVQSDNQLGVDSITISNLILTTTSLSVIQVSGPHSGDELQPGNYDVIYNTFDCAGNSNSCLFNIMVNPAPNHLLSNCSRDTIILMPDPTNCDTLVDGLIPIVNNYCPVYNDFKGSFYPAAYSGTLFKDLYKEGPGNDNIVGTDGLVMVDPGGTKLTIVGTNNGTPPDLVQLKFDTSVIRTCVTIPCAGTVTFDWTAMMRGGFFRYDEAGFQLIDDNGTKDSILGKPPFANIANGSIVLYVANPSILCFYVRSDNRVYEDTFMITNFVFTPNPDELMQLCGPDLTLPVGPGVYDLCYGIRGCFGTSESCNFKLTVKNDYPMVCKDINLSLDSLCHATVTPGMLLAGGGCTATMKVELSHYGKPILNPVDTNFLNKKIIGRVIDTLSGNSCWSNILIEDKLSPGII